jgi:hypothetical protein
MSHGLGGRGLDPKLVTYRPETDFIRVRAFLVQTYARFEAPVNWGIERWNYARYFVAPMLGSYGTPTVGEPRWYLGSQR